MPKAYPLFLVFALYSSGIGLRVRKRMSLSIVDMLIFINLSLVLWQSVIIFAAPRVSESNGNLL